MILSENKITIIKVDNGFLLQFVEIVGKVYDESGKEVGNKGEFRQRVVEGNFQGMCEAIGDMFFPDEIAEYDDRKRNR